jgi:hypothetical protein
MAAPQAYQIRLAGVLEPTWSEWLEGMVISEEPGGVTMLSGSVRDQAELFGLLIKVRDLGLDLISVMRLEPPDADKKSTGSVAPSV